MWKVLWCIVMGHERFRPYGDALMNVRNVDGRLLWEVHICKRCGGVFANAWGRHD